MSVHPSRHPQECACLFCGERLQDWFHAWYEHVERKDACRSAWLEWMAVVRREAGGT